MTKPISMKKSTLYNVRLFRPTGLYSVALEPLVKYRVARRAVKRLKKLGYDGYVAPMKVWSKA